MKYKLRKLTKLLLVISLFAIVLPLTFNACMHLTSKGSNVTLIGIAYGIDLKTEYTKINLVRFTIAGATYEVSSSGQSVTVEVDSNLTSIYADVRLSTNYASTNQEAIDRTRVTFKLTAPNSTIVYNQVISDETIVGGGGASPYYWVWYRGITSIVLTEGTWTWEATYDIYVL